MKQFSVPRSPEITEDRIGLGKMLFNDESLSKENYKKHTLLTDLIVSAFVVLFTFEFPI